MGKKIALIAGTTALFIMALTPLAYGASGDSSSVGQPMPPSVPAMSFGATVSPPTSITTGVPATTFAAPSVFAGKS